LFTAVTIEIILPYLRAVNCLQTSNLMLIESISREPLQFHVLPFDAPKIRHALQVSLTIDTCLNAFFSLCFIVLFKMSWGKVKAVHGL